MKKTLLILGLGVFLYACNDSAKTEDKKGGEAEKPKTEKKEQQESKKDTEKKEEPSKASVELEDRAYTVEEFAEMYAANKAGLKGQSITIEGFYMNHNKQKAANSDDEYEYNVTLYKDESFDRDAAQAFFKMKSNNGDQFDGIKQKDKIKVTGKITGDEFFDAPLLEEGVIAK